MIITIIIISLKQCNKQLHGIAFGVTSQFVDKQSNTWVTLLRNPDFFFGVGFLTPISRRNLDQGNSG